MGISKGIVDRIMKNGRFLKQTGRNHEWKVISKSEARLKVAQCFQYQKRRLATPTCSPVRQAWSSDEEPEDFSAAPEDDVAISDEDRCLQQMVDDRAVDPFSQDTAEFLSVLPHADIEKELGFSFNHQSVPSLKDLLCQPGNLQNLHDLGKTVKDKCANAGVDFEPFENWHLPIDISDLSEYFDDSSFFLP